VISLYWATLNVLYSYVHFIIFEPIFDQTGILGRRHKCHWHCQNLCCAWRNQGRRTFLVITALMFLQLPVKHLVSSLISHVCLHFLF